MKRKKIMCICVILLLLATIIFEFQVPEQCSSSVFSTADGKEIELYVVMNTLLPVDVEEMTDEIIAHHQQVNGVGENTVYKIHLYRTRLHYRKNIEYGYIK